MTMWPGRRQAGWWWVLLMVAVTAADEVTTSPPSPAPETPPSPAPEPPPSPTPESPPSPTPATKPPHIILILADDLGWNDVSWHNQQVVMPQLESLARDGVLLEQSYVQPICTPTRSALLAGRYPFTIGRQHSTLKPAEPIGLNLTVTLLPQSLKAAGYSTHAVGKWHLGFCSWDYTPTKRGFDTFYGYYTGSEDYYTHKRMNAFSHRMDDCNDPDTDHCNGPPQKPDRRHPWLDLRNNTEPDRSKEGVYSTYVYASYVEQLLSSLNSEDPMFLYLAFQSVHGPLEVPLNYTRHYKHIHHHDRRTYLGMVSAMDEAVGRVVAALKASGHYNNSIIVFTTDNGGPTKRSANNWPLRGHKATLWEGGTRGAAFVHSHLLPNPGTVSHQLMHVTDWYRTLVGVAGGVVPKETEGLDQWAAITGAAPSPRTHMVYNIDNTTHFQAGVRLGDYKLLVGDPGNGNWTPPPELTQPRIPSNLTLHTLLPSSTPSPKRPAVTSAATALLPDLVKTNVRTSNDIQGRLKSPRVSNSENDSIEAGRIIAVERTTPSSTTKQTQVPTKKTAAMIHHQKYLIYMRRRRKRSAPFVISIEAPESDESSVVEAEESDLEDRYENDIRRFQVVASTPGISLTGVDQTSTSDVNTAITLSTTDASTANTSLVNPPGTSGVDGGSSRSREEDEDGARKAVLEADVRHLLHLLTKKNESSIRLYNLKDDPNERVDLSQKRVEVVAEALQFLLQEITRYVPAEIKPEVPAVADPARWQGVWSPGWC